jgi:hypothetical protein
VLRIAERGIGFRKNWQGWASSIPATWLSEQNSSEKRPYLNVVLTPGNLNS